MQHIQNKWEHFTQTGKVEDYLAYRRQREQSAAAATGAVNNYAEQHRWNSAKKLPLGGR